MKLLIIKKVMKNSVNQVKIKKKRKKLRYYIWIWRGNDGINKVINGNKLA